MDVVLYVKLSHDVATNAVPRSKLSFMCIFKAKERYKIEQNSKQFNSIKLDFLKSFHKQFWIGSEEIIADVMI